LFQQFHGVPNCTVIGQFAIHRMLTTCSIESVAIDALGRQSIAKIVVKSEYSKMPKTIPTTAAENFRQTFSSSQHLHQPSDRVWGN
jgi:hypothetical protein